MTLDYLPPSANHLWVTSRYGGNYLSTEYKKFKSKIAADWIKYRKLNPEIKPYLNNQKLKIRLIIHPRDKRIKFDLDNRVKGLLDALNGLCWEDDNQLNVMYLEKRDPMPPSGRTILTVKEIDERETPDA